MNDNTNTHPNPTEVGTPLLDVDGVAASLSISRRMATDLVYGRAVPVVKIGRLVRVRRSDLDAYVAAQTIPANI